MYSDFERLILLVMRKIYFKINKLSPVTQIFEDYVTTRDGDANEFIYKSIQSGKPLMVSKFGTIELNALVSYQLQLKKNYSVSDRISFIKGKIPNLWWPIKLDALCTNAGFFPNNNEKLPEFYQVNLEAIKSIDILGSYIEKEIFFSDVYSKDMIRVNLDGYYAPFLYEKPWTAALKGKKVLVIHPFDSEIKSQYSKRALLWKDKNVLPDFDLITYKPVVSMLGQQTEYRSWIEALEKMQSDIQKIDFDIALIGCGAYGMPLASFIKGIGKQAVHLAGWTQILFGIKGKRWDDLPYVSKFYNNAWVRPQQQSKIKGFDSIEKGCYW
ncbi:TPA: hypothetical protein ACYVCL_004652 [Klebsiella pneumoniae]|uniref:hypothetical protein n=1 Tax=Klebsiella pneumoniae TaxID=573 RepID=UPI0009BB8A55|nr:hypothetical protein [Klebsiella pneumoniae]EIV9538091.1 hypothetical protein [Klebsiella pneumoniae]ELA0950847.1 hypothetical protein [Klebsiella pneumoniae]SLV96052.1 Uncharacterised protein [Klebsiella pneumoniae]SLW67086.1 Uncharacterised protein [Klebsiella pneumoniae]VGH61113.1 Uncharacterised protein [Klebsiella pneumoniae]